MPTTPELIFHIAVSICDDHVQEIVSGSKFENLLATDIVDNEENAVRLAEQMVREAFKRLREKHSLYVIECDKGIGIFSSKEDAHRVLRGEL